MPGSGIVYTLTKRDAEQVATFLTANGIAARSYSGEQETGERIATEESLLRNEIKAVVATSALGMGYDKSDLTFVVHFQAPGSVVSYYQQVGRAGRGVDHADVVLLRGDEDRRIQDFFIEQAFPAQERVRAVLDDLEVAGREGRTAAQLMGVVNLGKGRIEAMLKILDVEGAVRRSGNRWQAVPGSDWSYDAERYEQVTALRRAEQTAMAAYGTDGRCLMRVLQEELDDPDPQDCGRCSVCTAPRFADPPAARLVELAQRHLRSRPLELEVRKMAPDAGGTMRKIPENARTEPGWALARVGDGGWWPAIERGFRAERLDDEIAVALADIVRGAGTSVAWVTTRPVRAPGRRLYPVGRAPRRGARCRAARTDRAHGTSSAPARDGQRGAAGRQRPRSFHDHRDSPGRRRHPPRRPALLRLDARHGGRPTAESWSAGRAPGGARNVVLGTGSSPPPRVSRRTSGCGGWSRSTPSRRPGRPTAR